MKLSEYKNDFYEFSGLASSASRQLAFAGIAIIWLFKTSSGDDYNLPSELFIPAAALITSLGSDLLQYVFGAIIWGRFHRKHEKLRSSIEDDPILEAPAYFNLPIKLFFYLKIFAVLVAYFYLLVFAISAIKFT